ncbi:MAG: HIT family protein [Candidatus Woesearchaeota archaeon]
MVACEICEAIKKPESKLYEEKNFAVILPSRPAVPGHIQLVPKEHKVILEELTNETVAFLFAKARLFLMALFEGLNCHGTNLLIMNGTAAGQSVAHIAVNLIPRFEDDGLELGWQPKRLSEEEMSTVELRLKEEATKITIVEEEKKEEKQITIEAPKKFDEEWLKQQLRRIP